MLKQFIKQWKRAALLSPSQYSSNSGSSRHIPSGFLAVYVGQNRMRFLIPVRFLHLPIFIALLEKAEEEYGFKFSGGIVLPCEVDLFKQVLRFLDKDEKKYGRLRVNEFLKLISDSSSCKEEEGNFSHCHHGLIPLMQKAARV
ncbi:auxin-induced protein 6B [Hevea brasiliensis]|nr:auxin-induced protein 6B [Hevea brasiliensis]